MNMFSYVAGFIILATLVGAGYLYSENQIHLKQTGSVPNIHTNTEGEATETIVPSASSSVPSEKVDTSSASTSATSDLKTKK